MAREIIQPTAAQQGVVNFGLEQAANALPSVFEAILKLRTGEQEQGQKLFEVLARANPELATYLVQQPGVVQALTAAPRVTFGKRGPSPSETVAGAARTYQPPQAPPKISAGNREELINYLLPEEATPENLQALRTIFNENAGEAAIAAATDQLHRKAPASIERAGMTGEFKTFVDQARVGAQVGLWPDTASGVKALLDAKTQPQQLRAMQQQIDEIKWQMLQSDFKRGGDITPLLDAARTKLSQLQEEKKKALAEKKQYEAASKAAAIGEKTGDKESTSYLQQILDLAPSPEQVKDADSRIQSLTSDIVVWQQRLDQLQAEYEKRTGGGGAAAAPKSRTPLEQLDPDYQPPKE